jgi:hypothetical protein
MPPSHYSNVAINMFTGWKSISSNYKTHAFACNIEQQSYMEQLLANPSLMKVTDYISPHCISNNEWDRGLIQLTYDKCKRVGKLVSLLEISPLGKWERMNTIVGKCDMYAIVLIIRNSLIGQGNKITIDDLLIYDLLDKLSVLKSSKCIENYSPASIANPYSLAKSSFAFILLPNPFRDNGSLFLNLISIEFILWAYIYFKLILFFINLRTNFRSLSFTQINLMVFMFIFVLLSALTEVNLGTSLRHRSLLLVVILLLLTSNHSNKVNHKESN